MIPKAGVALPRKRRQEHLEAMRHSGRNSLICSNKCLQWLPERAGGLNHSSFAYSALACFRIGMSGSASFQRVRKFL